MSRNHQSRSGNELLDLGILVLVGAHEPRGDRQDLLLGDAVRLLGGDDLSSTKIQVLLPLFGVSFLSKNASCSSASKNFGLSSLPLRDLKLGFNTIRLTSSTLGMKTGSCSAVHSP